MQEQGCSVAWRLAGGGTGQGGGWGARGRSREGPEGAGQGAGPGLCAEGQGLIRFNTTSGCSVGKELQRARVVTRSRAGERRLLSGQGRWWAGRQDGGWLESGREVLGESGFRGEHQLSSSWL